MVLVFYYHVFGGLSAQHECFYTTEVRLWRGKLAWCCNDVIKTRMLQLKFPFSATENSVLEPEVRTLQRKLAWCCNDVIKPHILLIKIHIFSNGEFRAGGGSADPAAEAGPPRQWRHQNGAWASQAQGKGIHMYIYFSSTYTGFSFIRHNSDSTVWEGAWDWTLDCCALVVGVLNHWANTYHPHLATSHAWLLSILSIVQYCTRKTLYFC